MTTIYVDADACPVRDETARVAERHGVAVVMVTNGGIRPSREPHVSLIIVPEGADEADRWIAERIGPGDVCITGDVPLAARCVEAGAEALRPNGEAFTATNVGQALAMRDLMADMRAADPLMQSTRGGGRPFTRADRSRFLQSLDRMVRAAVRNTETRG